MSKTELKMLILDGEYNTLVNHLEKRGADVAQHKALLSDINRLESRMKAEKRTYNQLDYERKSILKNGLTDSLIDLINIYF